MLSPEFPLVPSTDDWPLFDELLLGTFSDSSSASPSPDAASDPLPTLPFPSAADLAAMPIPPSRSSPRNKNPDHIPRPRNAFMLFRSAFAAAQKITSNVEHDNRHITRIIAHCWRRLSDAEKQVWRDKAAAEKAQHAARYPNYRFSPVCRTNRPVKRNVRRNGVGDVKRCETLAELVMSGKHGDELESAIKRFDDEQSQTVIIDRDLKGQESVNDDVPPFLSPLLPPAQTAPSDQPEATVACIEPQPDAFYSRNAFESLFASYPDEYQYLPEARNGAPYMRPGMPFGDQLEYYHHRRIMDLVQDLDFFSWNQPDNFNTFYR